MKFYELANVFLIDSNQWQFMRSIFSQQGRSEQCESKLGGNERKREEEETPNYFIMIILILSAQQQKKVFWQFLGDEMATNDMQQLTKFNIHLNSSNNEKKTFYALRATLCCLFKFNARQPIKMTNAFLISFVFFSLFRRVLGSESNHFFRHFRPLAEWRSINTYYHEVVSPVLLFS